MSGCCWGLVVLRGGGGRAVLGGGGRWGAAGTGVSDGRGGEEHVERGPGGLVGA